MEQGLTGKRVLVTGAGRGIGLTVASAFAAAGARVVTCQRGRPPAALADTGVVCVRADVTRREEVNELAEACKRELGGLDVLVNNVGVDGSAPLDELDDPEWRRLFDHNVTSAFLVTQALLGQLADGASIVNIGAAAALRGRPNAVHYSASKAALVGFTRALSRELGSRGIRVNLVSPGPVLDDEHAPPPPVVQHLVRMTALGRLARAEDIAGPVLFLAGDASRYVTGANLTIDGGI
ncbi:SDR family NAD(P)-dependent oxidoreductase [Dactylosporangium fulvum]|uniref:SDR family oxidoreductase n=1 Tax=Dactylosporangium fulvum TaxID=53359 RepID=A0ABY5W7N7_9ACTN|nr:SDR family oxidoreductase [Dactylosporangium fulvum]UWP86093.1 SDR family oxidoreductase [Dactylosporangium fulvum]